MSVDHYENFPVASWLCPAPLRPAVTAIYWFARTADDIADEGTATPQQRKADLAAYRKELSWLAAGGQPHVRFAAVFTPLAAAIREHRLPVHLLDDLLDAFIQDAGNPTYADRTALLDYCRRSANPIGRLLLHLQAVHGRAALAQSDAICTALQLINFWQDLSVDLPRGRCYVPASDAKRHGLAIDSLPGRGGADASGRAAASAASLAPGSTPAAPRELVKDLVAWARELMLSGAPLVHTMPGRSSWELRLVVQGGLRILDKIEAMDFDSFTRRPTLGSLDAPALLWRCLRMRPEARAAGSVRT